MSFVVAARWTTNDENRREVEEILRAFVPLCRSEPGCRSFVAHQSIDRPNEFLLYEHYGEEQDFITHQATSHFKEWVLNRAVPLLVSRERVPYAIIA